MAEDKHTTEAEVSLYLVGTGREISIVNQEGYIEIPIEEWERIKSTIDKGLQERRIMGLDDE